jgi:hypothetical protein
MKKQIEDMAECIWDSLPDYEPTFLDCEDIAEKMFAKGYRKASTVAREIFEEFKAEMRSRLHSVEELYKEDADDFYGGQSWAYSAAIFVLDNIIKKKYESEGADND